MKNGSCSVVFFSVFFLIGCGKFTNPFFPEAKKSSGITITAKVRDFREGNATSKDGTHPHFEQGQGSCEAQVLGIKTVEEAITTNGLADPNFPGDERDPALVPDLPASVARCFTPPERFSDWFNDRGPDTNRPFFFNLTFSEGDGGIYAYRSDSFFPIDNGAGYTKESAEGPETFGHLQTGIKDGVDLSKHNYGFTMEFHTNVTYAAGKGQFIAFEGDDDLWAFINGKRVIDLGGIHAAERDTVRLDNLGLTDQGKYPLDFFFAERAVASSKLSIVTNVRFTKD